MFTFQNSGTRHRESMLANKRRKVPCYDRVAPFVQVNVIPVILLHAGFSRPLGLHVQNWNAPSFCPGPKFLIENGRRALLRLHTAPIRVVENCHRFAGSADGVDKHP
jgi:hypothetical protein